MIASKNRQAYLLATVLCSLMECTEQTQLHNTAVDMQRVQYLAQLSLNSGEIPIEKMQLPQTESDPRPMSHFMALQQQTVLTQVKNTAPNFLSEEGDDSDSDSGSESDSSTDSDSSDDEDASGTDNGKATMKLENNSNFNYVATLSVGTPPQEVRAIMDTGSANTWIISKEAADASGMYHQPFDPDESTTFEWSDQTAYISFGSGDLSGNFVTDTITVGDDKTGQQIVIPNDQFGLVLEESVFWSDFDAIVGLAYPAMAEPNSTPLMDQMIDQELLKDNVFAFYMSMNPDEQSTLQFGGYNTNKFEGELQYHDVVDKLFWSLQLDDILINGEPLHLCDDKDCMITPDSGTSLLTMPSWAFELALPQLPTDYQCESDLGFGDMTVVIEGIEYDIPSAHWMEMWIGEGDENPDGGNYDLCVTSLDTLDIYQEGQQNLFIFGDSFMQLYYTVFDRDFDRVGLAKALHNEPEILHDMDNIWLDEYEMTEDMMDEYDTWQAQMAQNKI